jgi:valyl-tRNA synthetase
MDKAYEPQNCEDDIYKAWEESGAFQPSDDPEKEPYVIAIPPPNVTGTLHAGHAMYIVQDILIRWQRMQGKAALYIPGTDHAAIATESVVLKNLGIKDRNKEISREDFMKEAEKWVEVTGGRIKHQLRKIGLSCDWTREAYTFDEERNVGVNTIFKKLYDKGLIYRGDRMVNWSVGAQSVLSDDELEWEEKTESFYSIRCGEFIIGTARSETKCADSPLFINPDGVYVRVRYSSPEGKTDTVIIAKNLFDDAPRRKKLLSLIETDGVIVELLEEIPGKDLLGQEFEYETYAGKRKFVVMGDSEIIDMEKGTGAMTISVNHSADDYELAQKHGLDRYRFDKIDFEGNMTAVAGELAGMPLFKARKQSAIIMQQKGLLVGEDTNYSHRVPICYRSSTVVEPMVSKQWFVDVEKKFEEDFGKNPPQSPFQKGEGSAPKTSLKEMTLSAVRDSHVKIVPDRFDKTYFHWIENLRDWCISRQIWWGHRIPVWYNEAGEIVAVGFLTPEQEKMNLRQDEDTLDTWFSSALWPFSTLGWPNTNHADYQRFYPTAVLETGYDILFFWVARMIMFGKFATGEYPFHTAYLHGLVCDAKGQKMSKSKGNGIDPLDVTAKFGTDALRLSLVIGTTPGNNSNIGEEKIAGCRNFCNKLWNISRYIFSQIEAGAGEQKQQQAPTALEAWMIDKTNALIKDVQTDLEKYRFGDAAQKLWNFTWDELADWAVEAAKAENSVATNVLLKNSLGILLKLWHPFLPFVTEKIYQEGITARVFMAEESNMLITADWPKASRVSFSDADFEQVREVVKKIRSMRKLAGVDPTRKIDCIISAKDKAVLQENSHIIISLARLENLTFGTIPEEKGARDMIGEVEVFLPSAGMVDPAAEQARIQKELIGAEKQLAAITGKLDNEQFVAKAPPALVEKSRAQAAELQKKIELLKSEVV